MVIYKDGSVTKESENGWGFVACREGRVVAKRSDALQSLHPARTWSLRRYSRHLDGLVNQDMSEDVFVMDLQSMQRKIEKNFPRRESMNLLGQSHVRS